MNLKFEIAGQDYPMISGRILFRVCRVRTADDKTFGWSPRGVD
jgi:hypothetical protein